VKNRGIDLSHSHRTHIKLRKFAEFEWLVHKALLL
jgi:hypothetical protein